MCRSVLLVVKRTPRYLELVGRHVCNFLSDGLKYMCVYGCMHGYIRREEGKKERRKEREGEGKTEEETETQRGETEGGE